MKKLFKNIKQLIQIRDKTERKVSGADMKTLPTIENAYLLIDGDRISSFGKMKDCPSSGFDQEIDVTGQMILPTWCDSHTHLVYAANREGEFVDRINGLSYEEIANRGGGILNSAKMLQASSFEDLYQQSAKRLQEIMAMGTGAVEIKSGYGLTVEAEIKMLKVIQQLKQNFDIPIRATFLGAHALPTKYKKDKTAFLDMMIEEALPQIADQNLADYIDIFCEKGYFDVEDTRRFLAAGKAAGLTPKIHVNQFNAIGGVQAGVAHNALSVDHLEVMREEDILALQKTETMPVGLPSCSYFLSIPYAPLRQMIDSGLPVAIASDYNPGSTPSGNMNFVLATACIKSRLTPQEAINAATLNGAYAMGLEHELGSISVGKLANFIITPPISSYAFLPYSFGQAQIASVYIKGKKI